VNTMGRPQKNRSRMVSGKAKQSPTLTNAICCVHRVRREWLEDGDGPMFGPPPAWAESDVLAAYRRDNAALQARVDLLTREISQLAHQFGQAKIHRIREERVFAPKTSALCGWCEYREGCPVSPNRSGKVEPYTRPPAGGRRRAASASSDQLAFTFGG